MSTPTTEEMRELAIKNGVSNFEFDSWLDTVCSEDWEEYARKAGWTDVEGLDRTECLTLLDDLWAHLGADDRRDFYLDDKDYLLEYVVPLLREDDTARYHDDMHHTGAVQWCTNAYCKGEASV